eukprot:SM000167S02965  [mRNA]  locus=s167:240476:241133:+ [translate_table: standard]
MQRKPWKKVAGITTQGFSSFLQKAASGSQQALASRRLAVPAALMAMWAVTSHLSNKVEGHFHLELAPILLGFMAYKAAALIQAFRDNKELLSEL